ncbi:4Fe-4S dicluster domain-containing protein [Desulfolithobacter sp.]
MCEKKCATSHMGLSVKEAREAGIELVSRNRVVKLDDRKAVLQCMHCKDSPCVRACPLGVIQVENGIVRVHEEDCSGCGTCAMVCPVGAIDMREVEDQVEGKRRLVAIKCDLCYGQEEQACVAGCKFKALSLVTWEEFLAGSHQGASSHICQKTDERHHG